MKYRMKIYPWQNGQGWQAHDIADRTADTLEELFNQMLRLELAPDTDMDYSLDIYGDGKPIAGFWLSVYLQNGITIDSITYSAG